MCKSKIGHHAANESEGVHVLFCDGEAQNLNPSLACVPQERQKCVLCSLCSIRSSSFVEGAVSGVRVSAVIVGENKEAGVGFCGVKDGKVGAKMLKSLSGWLHFHSIRICVPTAVLTQVRLLLLSKACSGNVRYG
jgi:hypothetical protein